MRADCFHGMGHKHIRPQFVFSIAGFQPFQGQRKLIDHARRRSESSPAISNASARSTVNAFFKATSSGIAPRSALRNFFAHRTLRASPD